MIIHIVKPGETVYSIARQYSASPSQIIRDNGLGPSGYPGRAGRIALFDSDKIQNGGKSATA